MSNDASNAESEVTEVEVSEAEAGASASSQATTESAKKPIGPFGYLVRIFTTILALCIVVLLTLSVIIPAIFGWVPLTITSGSMEPNYPVGSLVISEPVDESTQLATGDVITFMPYPDDPTLVTHRIVRQVTGTDGTHIYTTQGDNNDSPDPDPVADYQVRAVAKYHIPYMGYVTTILDGHQKSIGVAVVIASLFTYVACQLVMLIRERRQDKRA